MKRTTEPPQPLAFHRRVLHLIIATGIASVAGQLVFMREYQAQFQGNEMVIALVLFLWLLLGGVGTQLARVGQRISDTRLVWLSYALAAFSGGQLLLIRYLRWGLFEQGLSLGFYTIFLFTCLTLAPYALLVGYLLPYSLRVIRSQIELFPGTKVYLADNLGDVCGGALFAFVLVFHLTPLQALMAVHLPMVWAAWRLSPSRKRWLTLGAFLAAACPVAALFWEQPSLIPGGGQLLAYEESRYARLTVQRQEDQATLFANGRPISGSHQTAQAEAGIHYPLSQLGPSPRILLISAQGGMLEEIAKHHPSAVDFVDLDPVAARMQFEYGIMNPIAQMRTIHMDGRRWLSTTHTTYDAILVNLPDPDTLQLNRFFTDRFYKLAAQHLADDGILSFHVQGYANTMTDHQRQKLASLQATAKRYFHNVRPLPGERIYFLCRQHPIDVDIPARLADKGIATNYIEAFFYGDVSIERMTALDRELDLPARLNRDKSPFLMRLALRHWFAKFGTSPSYFIIALVLLISVFLWRRSQQEFMLFTSGWTLMGSEILMIFAYQIYFGYIYMQLGTMVTVFLLGLLPGAWLGYRWKGRTGYVLLGTEMVLVLLMAMVAGLFQWGADSLPAWVYYLWGFLISLVCGFQFPQALFVLKDTHSSAAQLFSADLMGAACGALVTGTLLVPYLGLVGTAMVLMGLKLISLAVVGGQRGHAAPEST